MANDNSPTTSLEEISFITFMARLMPALGISEQASPTAACNMLILPATPRNLALMRDIQSYRQLVWANLPTRTRIEIAFGDTGAPSNFDFYFDQHPVTEDDLFS